MPGRKTGSGMEVGCESQSAGFGSKDRQQGQKLASRAPAEPVKSSDHGGPDKLFPQFSAILSLGWRRIGN
ncbi:hypothetical protein MLD38_040586 [Melastoma candidum]|nr:hypothetical protein MLD38_040586 [Melastoma candidum]